MIEVEIPDGIVEFPDDMQPEQIQSVLQKRFPKQQPTGDTTAEGLPRFQTPKGLAAPTEEEMREPAVSALDTLTTSPIKYLPPAAQSVARKITGPLGGGVIGAAGEALSTLAPKTKLGQIGKGISEAQTDNAEFFTSPLGAATLGIGGLPAVAQRAVALGFAAQMASQVPDLSKQLGEELGKPEDQRDYQKIAKLVTQGATTIGFTAGAGTHALAPRRPPIIPPPDVPQPIAPPPELRPTVSETTPPVPPAEMPETPTPETKSPLQTAWDKYDETGESTVDDLANEVEAILSESDKPSSKLQKALAKFKKEQEDDRALGGRGDMDEATEKFSDAIASELAKETKKGERPVSSALKDLDTREIWHGEPTHGLLHDKIPNFKNRNLEAGFWTNKGKYWTQEQTERATGLSSGEELFVMSPEELKKWKQVQEEVRKAGETKKGEPSASEIETPTEVHGDVRPLEEPAKPLPVEESGGGIQPQAQGRIQEGQAPSEVVLKPREVVPVWKVSYTDIETRNARRPFFKLSVLAEGKTRAEAIQRVKDYHGNPSRYGEFRASRAPEGTKADYQFEAPKSVEPKQTERLKGEGGQPPPPQIATAKIQQQVQAVAKTEGQRSAKEIKSELVQRLEKAIEDAPKLADVERKTATDAKMRTYETQPDRRTKITIDIPGDGKFTVWNTKENLSALAKRAKAIKTSPGAPTKITRTGLGVEAEDWVKEQLKAQPIAQAEARPITEEGAMQSGPALGIDEFVKKDVAPFLKKGVDAGKALVDIMVDTFSPASRTSSRDVDVLFASKGYKEKVITRAADALTKSGDILDKLPESEQIAFVDRVKRGQRQPTPELQRAADLMRKWDDRLFAMVRRYRPDLPYLENHNRVLWKVIPGSPQAKGASVTAVRSRRPWQGSKGFLKRHVLDDMSTGIAKGGIPVTYNPIDMFLLHAEDAMKFVAANRAWEGLKKTGSVEWVKTGQRPPLDYVRISDSIAKPYFKTPQGLLAKAGEWYVEPGAARMIENYLSRDYIRTGKFGPVGRAMLALKNATTAIELGLSPFHAVFESNEVMGSSIGLGLAKLASGKLSGIKDILGAPFSPKTTSRLGKLGIQYAKNPTEFARVYPDAYKWFTTKYPEAGKLIDDLFAGGGQPGMNEDYRVRGIQGFKKAVAEGNYPGAILRTFPALNELAMKPLFQTYIPRLKVGMFLREYSFELERNAKQLADGKITRGELARKTWAFNEDRFGELNFDNLYWDRTFKSAMQLLFRSVTWKIGNLRGFGKAARDIWTEGLKPLTQGEKPRVTLPMAWLGGMAFVTAVQASIISKVATGKYPWELAKDNIDFLRNLVFPRIDPDDERQRVSIPTYWRDLVHLAHSPVGYVGSSMTGEWRRLYDDLVNKDFYKHPIYNPNDPIQKKAVAALEHLIPLPFGASSFVGATKEGVGPARASAGFLGFTKAPSYISPPTAQTQVRDLALKWKTESKIPKLVNEAQRQATEQFEPSDYVPLRQALKNRNYEAARKALDNLLEQGHSTANIAQTMRPLNREGKPKPFTGSQLQEKYFLQSLTPKEKELYREAIRERIETYRRFREMIQP